MNVAEQAGDLENAGVAALTIIEHLSNSLSNAELSELIDRAKSLLEKTQDIGTLRRLAKATFRVLFLMQAPTAPPDWENFSLRKAVKRYEAKLIKAALADSKGSVTHASHLLGFKHHQSLVSLLGTRHKDLMPLRSVPRIRRKHLIVHPKK